MDQLKLEAAIQFGRITALNQTYEDKDIEEVREIFENVWDAFVDDLHYAYFTEYLEDQIDQQNFEEE